jgi:RimJ/RimL family protein N-acetyltransferase
VPFDAQPTLTGELLNLRPLREEDFDPLYAVGSDPLIWEQHPNSDRHELVVFREFFRDAMASGGALLVTDAATGAVIGSSRYHDFREAEREVEVGWTFLTRACWGGRYNGELKRLMLEHAFRYVDSVVLVIGATNTRSRRAAEKIGAVLYERRSDEAGHEKVVYRISGKWGVGSGE